MLVSLSLKLLLLTNGVGLTTFEILALAFAISINWTVPVSFFTLPHCQLCWPDRHYWISVAETATSLVGLFTQPWFHLSRWRNRQMQVKCQQKQEFSQNPGLSCTFHLFINFIQTKRRRRKEALVFRITT